GRVVAGLAVRLSHAGDQVDLQFGRQGRQAPVVGPRGDWLAQASVIGKRDTFVRNGVTVEETLGGDDNLGSLLGRFSDQWLGAAVVGLLVPADPLEDDASDADGWWWAGRSRRGGLATGREPVQRGDQDQAEHEQADPDAPRPAATDTDLAKTLHRSPLP